MNGKKDVDTIPEKYIMEIRIKWTNLRKSEIILCEYKGSLKKREAKIKTWIRNSTGSANYKSTKTG